MNRPLKECLENVETFKFTEDSCLEDCKNIRYDWQQVKLFALIGNAVAKAVETHQRGDVNVFKSSVMSAVDTVMSTFNG